MKKLLAVIIVLLVAILMALTVPDKQKHKDAMMEAVNEFVEEETVDKLGDNILAKLGKGVVVKTEETAHNAKLKVENEYVVKTANVLLKGEERS